MRVLVLSLVVLLTLCICSFATTVQIEQTMPAGNALKTYLSFSKDDDSPFGTVTKNELRLSLDGTPSTLFSLTPFAETGERMGITLLLDISKTMTNRQGPLGADPFTQLVKAAQKFIDAGSDNDSYCIITFGDEVKVVEPFNSNKASLRDSLASIKPIARNTLLYEGLQKALEINRQKGGNIPDRRAIIVISDGKDEGSGLTIDDVLKNNHASSIPIFSIGYTRIGAEHLTILRRLSNLSGGRYVASPTPQKIDQLLQEMNSAFKNSFVATFEPQYMSTAKAMDLKVVITRDGASAEATKSILLPAMSKPVSEEPKGFLNWLKTHQLWVAGGAALVLAGFASLFLVIRRRRAIAKAASLQAEALKSDQAYDATCFDYPGQMDLTPTGPQDPIHTSASNKQLKVCGSLVVVASSHPGYLPGMTFPVYEKTTIGRSDECLIQLEDPNISRHHCDIISSHGVSTLTDFRSTNGTFINGQRVDADTRLRHGDLLRVGQIELEFSEAE